MEQTERHLAAQTEEVRYRLLVKAVTDYAIFMLDPEGIVARWNPGAERFKGYTASDGASLEAFRSFRPTPFLWITGTPNRHDRLYRYFPK